MTSLSFEFRLFTNLKFRREQTIYIKPINNCIRNCIIWRRNHEFVNVTDTFTLTNLYKHLQTFTNLLQLQTRRPQWLISLYHTNIVCRRVINYDLIAIFLLLFEVQLSYNCKVINNVRYCFITVPDSDD